MSSTQPDLSTLKSLVTRSLITKGTLGQFKAQIRAAVFDIMQGEDRGEVFGENKEMTKVRDDEEFTIMCLVISQFLSKYNLKYTKSVFDQEVSLDSLRDFEQLSRIDLKERVGLSDTSDVNETPLLWQIMRQARQGHSTSGTSPQRANQSSAQLSQPQFTTPSSTSDHSNFVNRISSDQETPFTSPLKTQKQSLLGALPSLAQKQVGNERSLTPPDIPQDDDVSSDEGTQNDVIKLSGAAIRSATIGEQARHNGEQHEDEDGQQDDRNDQNSVGSEPESESEDKNSSSNSLEEQLQVEEDDFGEFTKDTDIEDEFDELHHSFEHDDTLNTTPAGDEDNNDHQDYQTQVEGDTSNLSSNSLEASPAQQQQKRNPLLDESSQKSLDKSTQNLTSDTHDATSNSLLDQSATSEHLPTQKDVDQDEFGVDADDFATPATDELASNNDILTRDDDDLKVEDDPFYAPVNDDFGDLDNLDEDLNLEEDWMNEDDFGGGMSGGSGGLGNSGGAYDFGDFEEEEDSQAKTNDFETQDEVANGLETYDEEIDLGIDDDEF